MRVLKSCLLATTLMALSACGGGGGGNPPGPTPASHLVYTDPSDANTYRWLKDASLSTNTHLVLYLAAPAGANLQGVGFHLTVVDATKASWAKVAPADTAFVQNAAFTLGTGTQALAAKVTGATLQGGVYQKAVNTAPVVSTGQPLVRIAVDLSSGTLPGPITIQQVTGKGLVLLSGSAATPGNLTMVLGTLQAQ